MKTQEILDLRIWEAPTLREALAMSRKAQQAEFDTQRRFELADGFWLGLCALGIATYRCDDDDTATYVPECNECGVPLKAAEVCECTDCVSAAYLRGEL